MPEETGIDVLLSLMSSLRDREYGCSWDKKQTLSSLTAHTLEEVYEVIEAVENGNDAQLQDELGDLLFQVVFYAQIATEEQRFVFSDVVTAITQKLLRRHPHIFPDGTLKSFGSSDIAGIDAMEVEARWEQIKNLERQQGAHVSFNKEPVLHSSVLDDIPQSLPALGRARKLQKRAASIGFDWAEYKPVLECLREEISELELAISEQNAEAIAEELGDLLFTCVNLSRHLRVDPESALRGSNKKFERRFRALELEAHKHTGSVQGHSMEQMDLWWESVKEKETHIHG
jgi:ATP diphosphatase